MTCTQMARVTDWQPRNCWRDQGTRGPDGEVKLKSISRKRMEFTNIRKRDV